MTQKNIIQVNPGDGLGDTAYIAFQKTQANFSELYESCARTAGPFSAFQGTIDARDYAVDPTGAIDSAPGLNLAIQDAIAQKKKLILPEGIFLCNSPLMCFAQPPGSGSYATLMMEGQGGPAPAISGVPTSELYSCNTILLSGSQVLPVLMFNANRNCVLKNFGIAGSNTAAYAASTPPGPLSTKASYISAGCRDSRYSPYCAIAIDALNVATAPADGGYAGLTYNQSVGQGSYGLTFENVHIVGFVVGVMGSPSGVSAQGDTCVFRNLYIQRCAIGYAFGSTQSRACTIQFGYVYNCWTALDTISYGTQTGCPPKMLSVTFVALYRLFQMTPSYGHALFVDIYAEGLLTLGTWGPDSSGIQPLTFLSCDIAIYSPGGASTPLLAPLMLEAWGPVKCIGTNFRNDAIATPVWNFFGGNGPLSFDHCYFHGPGTGFANVLPHIAMCVNATQFARFEDCWVNGAIYGGTSQVLSDDSGRSYGIGAFDAPAGRINATYQTTRVTDGNKEYWFVPPTGVAPQKTLSGVGSLAISGSTVTFTMTNAGYYLQPRDVLYWQMLPQGASAAERFSSIGASPYYASVPALIIPAGGISGNNVTANMLFDPAQYDTVAHAGYTTAISVAPNFWAPAVALTGVTATDNTLTSVSPTTILQNGDFVIGTNIPANTRVVSGGGTASLVLSQATTGNGTSTLYFGRLYSPTLTAAF